MCSSDLSFAESAAVLDKKRLLKQCVECTQILNALIPLDAGWRNQPKKGKGWRNHPAVLMWKGYEDALTVYYNTCFEEAVNKRGIKFQALTLLPVTYMYDVPPWVGNEKFHASHRSNLLRKDKEYYSQFGWTEPDNLEYVWPTKCGLMM